MIVNAKTSMDKFEDIEAGEVFLFCEDYYLKTQWKILRKMLLYVSTLIMVNLATLRNKI